MEYSNVSGVITLQYLGLLHSTPGKNNLIKSVGIEKNIEMAAKVFYN